MSHVDFSYRFNSGEPLIRSASLELPAGTRCLIIGESTQSYRVLGGLLGKTLPISADVPWPQVQKLFEPYTGTITFKSGQLPPLCSYVGPDPEQHLLLARVSENFQFNRVSNDAAITALRDFGLDASVFELPLCALSGGERMRVVLSLAFRARCDCYVLHGVLPWLDQNGRDLLLAKIATYPAARTIFLEHEVAPLVGIIDTAYRLDDGHLQPIPLDSFSNPVSSLLGTACPCRKTTESEETLVFDRVDFFDYPDSDRRRHMPILHGINTTFHAGTRYCLVGNNGSGKSTLARLMFRLVVPTKGAIRLCGRRLSDFTRQQLTSTISYVGQFPELQVVLSSVEQYRERARKNGNGLSETLLNRFFPNNIPATLLSPLDRKKNY